MSADAPSFSNALNSACAASAALYLKMAFVTAYTATASPASAPTPGISNASSPAPAIPPAACIPAAFLAVASEAYPSTPSTRPFIFFPYIFSPSFLPRKDPRASPATAANAVAITTPSIGPACMSTFMNLPPIFVKKPAILPVPPAPPPPDPKIPERIPPLITAPLPPMLARPLITPACLPAKVPALAVAAFAIPVAYC